MNGRPSREMKGLGGREMGRAAGEERVLENK